MMVRAPEDVAAQEERCLKCPRATMSAGDIDVCGETGIAIDLYCSRQDMPCPRTLPTGERAHSAATHRTNRPCGKSAVEPGKTPVESGEPAVELPPVDVVYTLSPESKQQDLELRYSLRSLQKFASGLGKVWVIGHQPQWLRGVNHVPHEHKHANKDADIINKLLLACRSGVSKRFIFASDDQCLLSHTDLRTMPARYSRIGGGRSGWMNRLRATRDYLLERGVSNPLNFDTHTFQPHDAEEFQAAASAAPYNTRTGMTVNTLVLNQSPSVARSPLGRSKLTQYHRCDDVDQLWRKLHGKQHLGYNNSAMSPAFLAVLQELFPAPSKFERDVIDLNGLRESSPPGKLFLGRDWSAMLREELEAILAQIPHTGQFLEIGTWHGLTASLLARARPGATIYSVDPCQRAGPGHWHGHRQPNMRLLVGTVADLLKLLPAASFDGAIIDGDHSFAGCYADLVACERLVKRGMPILLHDYRKVPGTIHKGKAGVRRAADQFAQERGWPVYESAGTLALMTVGASREPAALPVGGRPVIAAAAPLMAAQKHSARRRGPRRALERLRQATGSTGSPCGRRRTGRLSQEAQDATSPAKAG
jgi:hypothetical protein